MHSHTDFSHIDPPDKTLVNSRGRILKEADIESYGIKKSKRLGWTSEKFTSPQKRSVPDRMFTVPANLAFPYGFIFFIEMKRPKETATPAQLQDHTERRENGNLVFVCDSYEQIDVAFDTVNYILDTGNTVNLPWWLIL